MRALIDTNVFISFLLAAAGARGPATTPVAAVVGLALSGVFTLLAPGELLDELELKLKTKPSLTKRITAQETSDFIGVLRATAVLLPPLAGPAPAVVRDPKDDYLLAQALVGRADYLVTGDEDLLVLADQVAPLRIVTPADFVRILA